MANIKMSYVDTENFVEAVVAAKEAAEALYMNAYSDTFPGLFRLCEKEEDKEKRAYDYLSQNYSLASSVLRNIWVMLAPLSEGLINEEITITAKGE